MVRIKGFLEFCSFNSINNDSIYQIIPYLKVSHYAKNYSIFNIGDSSKHFYCILSGKVSIRFPALIPKKMSTLNKLENKVVDLNNNTLNTQAYSISQEKTDTLANVPFYKNLLKNQVAKKLCND